MITIVNISISAGSEALPDLLRESLALMNRAVQTGETVDAKINVRPHGSATIEVKRV